MIYSIFTEVNLKYILLHPFPPCLGPTTLFITNFALAAMHNDRPSRSVTSYCSVSFSDLVSTVELEGGHHQQLEPMGSHTEKTVS